MPTTLDANPQTTNVLSFFNNNDWAVDISISALNIKLRLEKKGDKVRDRDGKIINDPILDSYVGPGMLARELSPTPVRINRIVPPQVLANISSHSFAGTTDVKKGMESPAHIAIITDASQPLPNSVPILGMSVEVAKQLGYIKPTTTAVEMERLADDGSGTPNSSAPDLDDTVPRDLLPGELKRWREKQAADRAAAPVKPAPVQEAQAVQPQVEKVARPVRRHLPPESVQPDLTSLPASMQPLAQPPAPEPQPVVQETPISAPAAVDTSKKGRFVCAADNKPFDYRSQLKAWVVRKYPARVEELMAAYPPGPTAAS